MALTDDEHAVGTVLACRAHELLREGVHPRALRCCDQDIDAGGGENGVEGVGEFGVAVSDEVLEPAPAFSSSAVNSRASCVAQAPVVIRAACAGSGQLSVK
ncbi:hypothetical protein GCM10009839_89710 [Catenulispora yoronensis]|uniref:Uncharacterized protein n=1 Tax=Catenulispora yoronensis TaxID=450799 RepID=A0ABN2VLD6_9ACTN